MRNYSLKRQQENRRYTKLRLDYLKDHPYCEAEVQCCGLLATDIHHKKGRGVLLNATQYWLAVCRTCHDWVESHPNQAKELKLSVSRLNIFD